MGRDGPICRTGRTPYVRAGLLPVRGGAHFAGAVSVGHLEAGEHRHAFIVQVEISPSGVPQKLLAKKSIRLETPFTIPSKKVTGR